MYLWASFQVSKVLMLLPVSKIPHFSTYILDLNMIYCLLHLRKLNLRCFVLNPRCKNDEKELLKLATSIRETLEEKVRIESYSYQSVTYKCSVYKFSLNLQIQTLLLIDSDSRQVTWLHSVLIYKFIKC